MTVDFAEQRRRMVDSQLRTNEVRDRALLGALLEIPREEFVPALLRQLAYVDEDVEIAPAGAGGGARFLMEPAPFAKLVQNALVGPEDVVLDIGAGTGYSSAVLSRLAATVVALESDPALAEGAKATLARHGFADVEIVIGPLDGGHAGRAPYDVIFIEGAVERIPDELFAQLKDGGRLMAVVGAGLDGRATLFLKQDGVVSSRSLFNAAVRLLDAFRKEPAFEF